MGNIIAAPPALIAVTHEASARSRLLLESIGMTAIDSFVEFGAPQVMYSADGTDLRGTCVEAGD